jgi:malate dehydrogenase (oxaloacetate-decarboxylating)(NADP+)
MSSGGLDKDLVAAALDYHRHPTPGKISVVPTKALINQRDLALAYSPGVAAACDAIVANPVEAAALTSRGNLVGVVTNGTAVLGLGNIGPLAAKPVMEGKACLFKKFAGIDVFDLELAEGDRDKLVDMIAALEPTLGGVNLEDIKAPECFYIERQLRERMKIPVFHDDQHGTAIISAAALLNGLKVVGKDIGRIRVVCSGAGAAAVACLDLMVRLGVKRENVYVCDSKGVIFAGREKDLEQNKARYAQETTARRLADIVADADVFLGCSTAGVLTAEMVKTMAPAPLILALANPVPEIMPDVAKSARPDCVVATGRSDFPNQVNNVLCFPFLFRGALDVGATRITEEMKLACVYAIADLAHAEPSELVARAYGGSAELEFGPEYIIPKPFDPRLIIKIAPAVARAAMESNVATRPIADFDAYVRDLTNFVYHSGTIMRPVFATARDSGRRVLYAEGEDERVLRAARVVLDERLARPILIGRPAVIEMRIRKAGLNLQVERDFAVVNPESDPRYRDIWSEYFRIMSRKGVTPAIAQAEMRSNPTLIGAMLLRRGEADALIAGPSGLYTQQLKPIADVVGLSPKARLFAALSVLMLPKRTLFITDPYVNDNPDAEDIAAITVLAAAEVRRFGLTPRVALLSHSSFGSAPCASSAKMSRAREILAEIAPALEADGEMKADEALADDICTRVPDCSLKGPANLLVMPNRDAANISLNLLKAAQGEGITVGPILLGAAKPVHILTPSATVRRLLNVSALAVAQAAARRSTGS